MKEATAVPAQNPKRPIAKPKTAKSIFINIKNASPSKSKEMINPGNFTKKTSTISPNISKIQLLFKNKQAKKGKK